MHGSMWRRVVAMVAFGVAGATSAGAQAASATGAWSTSMARGMRNENGNITAESSIAMRLELKVEGDQVTGSWGPAEAPATGAATPRRAVKGTVKGNALALTADAQQARIMMNGEESTIQLIPTFTLTLDGDTLKGTLPRVPADGHEGMPAMPLTATRIKS